MLARTCLPESEDIVKDTQPSYKEGVGRTGRDDEEEWSGIPIPQSDDSEDEYWLDESSDDEPEQHEADTEPSIFNPRKPDDDSNDASSTHLPGTTTYSFTCIHGTEAHVIPKY